MTDFGVSFIANESNLVKGMVYSEVEGGSPGYAAPELLQSLVNRSSADKLDLNTMKSCDVYSFAVLLYEMCTMKLAWEGVPDIVRKVIEGRRPSLEMSNFVFPPSNHLQYIIQTIACAWSPNVRERPPMKLISSGLGSLKSNLPPN